MNTLDSQITSWIIRFHPGWWDFVMKAVSWPGYPPQTRFIMLGLAVIIILFVGLKQGLWVQGATLGSYLFGDILKYLINRPRPEKFGFVPWHKGLEGGQRSFPAGHVEIFTALCLTTAFFVGLKYPRAKKMFYILMVVFLILLGISRIYLAEHWFTDVLAGFGVGLGWTYIGIKSYENKSHL